MSEWKDESMSMAEYMHKALDRLMWERNLLYGTIIYLMISHNESEFSLPPEETIKSYGRDFYVIFNREGGEVTISLKERPVDE